MSSRIVALSPETGRIALDQPVALPLPRQSGDPGAAALLDALRDLAQDWPTPEAPQDADAGTARRVASAADYLGGTGAFRSVG